MIRTLLAARWLPWAAGAVCALIITAFSYGFMKGSHSKEVEMLNAAMAEQADVQKVAQKRQMAALQRKNRRENEAAQIQRIPRPDSALCDAGLEWMHALQDGVRSANHIARPD